MNLQSAHFNAPPPASCLQSLRQHLIELLAVFSLSVSVCVGVAQYQRRVGGNFQLNYANY